MKKPLISVITVSYNVVLNIEKTILSVINQSYDNIEYIIVDGYSNDGTLDIIDKYRTYLSFFVSEVDCGIYDAMNKGISCCSGEYVFFLNSNDYFIDENVVSSFVNLLNLESKNIDIYYGNIELEIKEKKIIQKPKELKQILYSMPFCHQAVFCSVKHIKTECFSLDYKLASDFLFFRNSFLNRVEFRYIDINICNYDLNGVSQKKYISYLKEKFFIINQSPKLNLVYLTSLLGLIRGNYLFLLKFFTLKLFRFRFYNLLFFVA